MWGVLLGVHRAGQLAPGAPGFYIKNLSGTFGKLFLFIFMKITKRQLRKLIREFLDIGRDFSIDLGTGDPPSGEPPGRGDGGSNKLHQLVRLDATSGEYDPQNYIAIPIDTTPGSVFSNMREEYDVLTDETKSALYALMPGNIPEVDTGVAMQIRDGYVNLINNWSDKIPQGAEYEYFTTFHPNYVNNESDEGKKMQLYQAVTGYTPAHELLNEFELIMHAASSLL